MDRGYIDNLADVSSACSVRKGAVERRESHVHASAYDKCK